MKESSRVGQAEEPRLNLPSTREPRAVQIQELSSELLPLHKPTSTSETTRSTARKDQIKKKQDIVTPKEKGQSNGQVLSIQKPKDLQKESNRPFSTTSFSLMQSNIPALNGQKKNSKKFTY